MQVIMSFREKKHTFISAILAEPAVSSQLAALAISIWRKTIAMQRAFIFQRKFLGTCVAQHSPYDR